MLVSYAYTTRQAKALGRMRIFSWALSLCTYAVPLGANSPSGGGFGANLNPPHLGAGGVLRVNDFGAGPRGV